MNVNQRMIARIERAMPRIPASDEARNVLSYVRAELEPDAIAKRPEWDQGVTHLLEVASQRLKPFETEENPT